MNCNCDFPARYLISRDGKPCYTCGLGRCRFYALAPVQCDGYTRVTLGAPGSPPLDTGVVMRFEALVHPAHEDAAAFMLRVHGDPSRWESLRREVLQDPQFEGAWYTTARAFLYPMSQYSRLVNVLKARALPNAALEEIPCFYFRCVERLRQIPLRYSEDVAAGRARRPDPDDCVFRQLKPFQKEGVRFVLAHQGRAMIADDMGLGKTVQAIAVAHHYRDEWPVLVVCPMSLLENWAKEFNRFCGIPYARIAILQGTKAKATSLHDVVIVSYNSLKCVEEAQFHVVILDESHYIKAGAAKRAQLSLKICRNSRRVLLLSGTPAMSRPIELYAQLQAMQPGIIPSKAHFGARYCNSYVSRFGIDMTGHSHTDELHSLLRHYMIRRTKKELGGELPSKSRQLLYVYITDKEKKALEKQIVALRRSLAASSGPSCSSALTGGGGASADFAARTPNAFEMKMATARAKIPAVQDYVGSIVEQHLDSGEKLILFAHHQCMMEALKAAVEAVRPRQPIDYIYISGDTPAAQREPAAEHFRTEPTCTVAILSMQSSGTGHNFTCASTVVFTELDWNPSTHLQCEDRVHRIGQAQPCHIKYLLAEGTSDSVIWPLLQTKLSVTTAMFENTGSAAEVQLHDGADKQNVARRDVVAASAAMSTAASTPSSSQQSTLDRFLPPPSPSQSMKGEEATAVNAAPPLNPALRLSVLSPPLLHQSSLRSTERDAVETPGLVLTPSSPAQRLSNGLMGSPLSLPRGSCSIAGGGHGDLKATTTAAAAAAATPVAPSLVVSFADMGNAYADALPRPHKHGTSLSSAAASLAAATATSAAGASPRGVKPGAAREEALPCTSAPSATAATSVLDLMRQTSSKPPLQVSSRAATSVLNPVIVDLTDATTTTTSCAPQGLSTQTAMQPLSASHIALPLAPFIVVTSPAATATAAAPPPRRTVFTLGSSSTSTSTSASLAATSASATAVAADVPYVSAPPVLVAPPIASQPPTYIRAALDVPLNSSCNNGSRTVPSAAAPLSNVGAVSIPLRPNLHFKRPRSDVEPGGSRGGPSGQAHAATTAPLRHFGESPLVAPAPLRNSHTRGEQSQQGAVPSSSVAVVSTPTSALSSSPSALSRHHVSAPHPLTLAAAPAGGFPLAASSAAIPPTSTATSGAARRTLFRLVSNGEGAQTVEKG
ncbi:putative DNA helicase [Leptomonas pyrrhocoris]|uniref:Putative DNA helicase n=1 Tax=Leptomonas pyrrhocoris TaxID=157538 RepID=A0A0M9FZC2_LEPPY|nr:putative DNA helicase [Leptomonas pyrrhocoris]KPA79073.1 putative DNA helicase [Leptomonas pyrrhocoris]|eukprot:XP_015657512.1 putative DNA helicase [Leptomonas pyrrhocoris]